jgi:hypothetical protein
MIEGWPEKIVAAQKIVSMRYEGRDVPRVRYGDERATGMLRTYSAMTAVFSRASFMFQAAMLKSAADNS